jgi:translocation and assembly module TamA
MHQAGNRSLTAPGIVRALCLCLAFASTSVLAEIRYEISGVDEELQNNILVHNQIVRLGRNDELSERDLADVLESSEAQTRAAMRPYGYYEPTINGRFEKLDNGDAVIYLVVNAGQPMIIGKLDVSVTGPGADRRALRNWRSGLPIREGDRLNQVLWEDEKKEVLRIAASEGFLAAKFTRHRLELNLETNNATAILQLETGRRYVIGDISFGDHVLRPGIVEYIPRFEPGDPYSASLMEDFRQDLWRTGYFTDVDVIESYDKDSDPPVVNLQVDLETETRNSYQGALGYGTDTGIRLQANWSKHPMSARGDRIDIGAGWQEFNSEFAIRAAYRLPLVHRAREYWTADAKISFENQDLELKRSQDDENFIKIANGNVDERHVRAGWLKVINSRSGEKQMFVTPFAQYLHSERRYDLLDPDDYPSDLTNDPDFGGLLRGTDDAFSIGVDLDIVAVVGKAFDTRGRRDRAWLFVSDNNLGSEVDFVQVYLSTRRSYLRGDRWKFILRAELGYTDADVDEFSVDAQGVPLELSVTQLPNYYRFKAGGSASVRGYAFEQLSNNNIGSNNIVTGSAEVEFRFSQKWSAAVFADVGNAFNDWSTPQLKLGVGVGVRWYSIAGPIRVDVAQARDFTGRPWRLHFTIGTPLL